MSGKRPVAYTGNKPFVFISYAHKDKQRVLPIIEGLQRRGIRVWYDEGLEVGSHWDEIIAQKVMQCSYLVCFITKNFLDSENCKNEIHMAAEEKKGPLITYLERVDLPPDMKLQYGRVHALSLPQHENLESFVDSIAMTEMLRPCCADTSKLPVRQASEPAPAPSKPAATYKRSSSGKGKIIAIAAAAVAVLALVLVLVIPGLGNDDPNLDGTGGSNAGEQLPKDPTDRYNLALTYIQEGKYYDAYVILKELGDYSDSASQMAAIREDAFLQQIKQAQPGDIVYWGSYEQDAVTSNGKEDIAWVVLYDDNGRKLLLSKESLDCQPYNETAGTTTWKTCTLRAWLNDDFYWDAFNEEEQAAIFYTPVTTLGSEDTRDRVFLLSREEVELYNEYCVSAEATDYAVRQGASEQRWWLRTPHIFHIDPSMEWADSINNQDASLRNNQVADDGIAVRPSIWVDTRTEDELEAEYNEALRLFENKNYKKAMTAFEALGDYKDSAEYYDRMPRLILMKPYAEAEVGDEVRIGNYDWIVVEKQEDKILVVSKYSIGIGDFVGAGWEITWDISGAREHLNGQFLNTLLQAGDEKSLILPTLVSTPANPEYGTAGGADVTDKVFLLSYEEVLKYFPDAQDRMLTTEADKNTTVLWWLRSMGQDITHAVYVDAYGNVLLEGFSTSPFSPTKLHFRPAMWISTEE